MPRIRTAIVGTGGIARSHAEATHKLADDVEVVAAVDVDPQRLDAFRETFGISAGYADLQTMLDQEKPDLVQIATPPALHIDLSIQCLEAGAWVLCEKPLTLSLSELDRLQDAERRTGRFCSVLFQWRHAAGARHVRKLIETQAMGRPLVAVCNTLWYRDDTYYAVPWRGTFESELGGVSMGHAIHVTDLLLYLLGDWSEIQAMIGTLERKIEVEDVALAMVRFANGALGSITSSVLSPRQESYLRLDFPRATVELTTLYGYRNENWAFSVRDNAPPEDLRALQEWQHFPDQTPTSHAGPLGEMLECMRLGKRPLTSGPEARRTVEFLISLYKSAMTGQPVQRGSIDARDPYYHGLAQRDPLTPRERVTP
jgi:predicted dehydrogenase